MFKIPIFHCPLIFILTGFAFFSGNEIIGQVKNHKGALVPVHLDGADSIHFITLRIYGEHDSEKLELINSMIRPGRLKREIDISLHHHSSKGQMLCSVLDDELKLRKSATFPYPLVEFVEYVDENGQWQKKEISSKEKEFLIRLPVNRHDQFLKFEKLVQNEDSQEKSLVTGKVVATIKIN